MRTFHIVSLLTCVSLALGTGRAGRWAGVAGAGRKPWAVQGDGRGWQCDCKISVPGSEDGKSLARRGVFFTFISWNLQSHLERDGWKKAGACGHSPSKRANNHQTDYLTTDYVYLNNVNDGLSSCVSPFYLQEGFWNFRKWKGFFNNWLNL